MKRRIAMLLAALLCLVALSACGEKEEQTEEQQAMAEIAEHLEEEAAADGVDLQEMMEQEAAEAHSMTEARNEQWEAQREAAQTEREERQAALDEINGYYDPLLQAEFDSLIEADTPEDVIAHGDAYNDLIAERNLKGEEEGFYWMDDTCYQALCCVYKAKAVLLPVQQYGTFDQYYVYGTGNYWGTEEKVMAVCTHENEMGQIIDCLIIKEDFSVCRLDAVSLFPNASNVQITKLGPSALELEVSENADFITYLFDITGPEAVLTAKSADYSYEEYYSMTEEAIPSEDYMAISYDYMPESLALEDLNRMVIANARGAEATAYR